MPYSFDQLLTINEPHLIERYERALAGFDLPSPGLPEFRIDMTGFSPEVAKALGNEDYLDPKDINRRFIIVSPEQAQLPVVHSSFSNTQDLMQEFFEGNMRELYALTIKDAVFGEIEDSVFMIKDINDLLSIEDVEFKISTPKGLPAKTAELKTRIDRLLKEPDAWRDDDMLNRMVELAKETGDIRDNELSPGEVVFRHENFWVSHLGGVYVFNEDKQITVICDPKAKGFRKSRPWQVSYLDINDHRKVFEFLEKSDRLQVPEEDWVEHSGLLDMRVKMAAVSLAASKKHALPSDLYDKAWMQSWLDKNRDTIKSDGNIPLLEWAIEEVDDDSYIDMGDVDADLRFSLCRANPKHTDFMLVNRLISEFLPFDFIMRFEFNRPNFIHGQKKWTRPYREFVANSLENNYLNNRNALYERLFRND